MGTKIVQLLVACLLLGAMGCQKEYEFTEGSENARTASRLKKYTERVTVPGSVALETVSVFQYDSKNRLSGISIIDQDIEIEFSYPEEKQLFFSLREDGETALEGYYYMNSNGLFDSTYQVNADGEKRAEKSFFNARKLPVRTIEYVYADGVPLPEQTIWYEYDAEDNLTKVEESGGKVIMNEYYDNLTGIVPDIFPSITPARKGKLIKSTKARINGIDTEVVEFQYTLDNMNRVMKADGTTKPSNVRVEKIYEYFN